MTSTADPPLVSGSSSRSGTGRDGTFPALVVDAGSDPLVSNYSARRASQGGWRRGGPQEAATPSEVGPTWGRAGASWCVA